MVGIKPRGDDLGLHEGGVFPFRQRVLRGQQGTGHLPARHQVAGQHEVGHAASEDGVGAGFGVTRHKLNHLHKGGASSVQSLGHHQGIRSALLLQISHCFFNLLRDGFGGLPPITRRLAAHQIIGLNSGRALVNRQNFGVAVMLGRTRFLNEAHAAVHLNAE